jgi:hypothetical protein
LMAPDAADGRYLGYRGSGTATTDTSKVSFDLGPEVHDENIKRWTPMNPTDRPDIRKNIIRLVRSAVQKLKAGDNETFEHFVPS